MTLLAIATALIVVFNAHRPAWTVLLIAGLGTAATRQTSPDLFGYEALNIDGGPWTWVIIATGLAGWALRNRSWRVAVVAVLLGVAPLVTDDAFVLALIPLAAAACAAGPRRDPLYVGGVVTAAAALLPFASALAPGSRFVSIEPGGLWMIAAAACLVAAIIGLVRGDWRLVVLAVVATGVAVVPFGAPWPVLAAAAVMVVGGVFR